MSDDHSDKKPQGNSSQPREGMKRRDVLLSGASLLAAAAMSGGAVATSATPASAQAASRRSRLLRLISTAPCCHLAEPTYPPITELDARNAKAPPIFEVKAPAGAPNVIVILLDNFGYAGSTTFGGVINLPTLDRLAKNGLIYNNFHVEPDLLGDAACRC